MGEQAIFFRFIDKKESHTKFSIFFRYVPQTEIYSALAKYTINVLKSGWIHRIN